MQTGYRTLFAVLLVCICSWFRQSKISSFQRQLNLYGFKRITIGQDKGGHYHELFLRGKQFLARRIPRFKVKNEGARKPTCPESEPDFYSYPSLRIELPLKENGSLKQPDSLKRTAFESIITAHTPGQNCPPVTTLGSDSAAGMVMTLPNAQLDTFLLHQQALLASRHCAAPILPAPLATMAPLAPSSVSILAAQWIAYNARNNNTVPMNPMPLISLPINASPPTHNSVAALSTQSSLHGLVSNDDLLRVALLENSSLRAGNLARSDNYTGVILSELQMATLARDYGSTTISAAAAAINDAGSAAARGIASFGRLQ